MTRIFIFLAIILGVIPSSFCQIRFTEAHPGMEWNATGTGQTTGHILDLIVHNTQKTSQRITLDAFYIPSDNTHQGYLVPIPNDSCILVDPGESVSVPLMGFCTDIHKPPLPLGMAAKSVHEWIIPDKTIVGPKPGEDLDETVFLPNINDRSGTKEDLESGPGSLGQTTGHIDSIMITFPGTEEPFGHTLDITKHPEEAAPILFKTLDRITETFDSLQSTNNIKTPFSFGKVLEKESVIQQTFWVYTSILGGEPYSKEDFSERLEEQFYTSTGQVAEEMDTNIQAQFNSGVDQFWSTFQLVGTAAKVITTKSVQPKQIQDVNKMRVRRTETEQQPKKKDDQEKFKIVRPVEVTNNVCHCSKCWFDPVSRYKKFKSKNGKRVYEEINNNKISTDYSLMFEFPSIKSNCTEGCPIRVEKKLTSKHWVKGKEAKTDAWEEGPQMLEDLNRPGKITFTAFFKVFCENKLCCTETLKDSFEIVESNNCCEELRNSNGAVSLKFGDNESLDFKKQSLIYKKDGQMTKYEFPNNIEAALCNLNGDGQAGIDSKSFNGKTIFSEKSTVDFSTKTNQAPFPIYMERRIGSAKKTPGKDPVSNYRLKFPMEDKIYNLYFNSKTCEIQVLVGDYNEYTAEGTYTSERFGLELGQLSDTPINNYWWERMFILYLQQEKFFFPYPNPEASREKYKQKLLKAIDQLLKTGEFKMLTQLELEGLKKAVLEGNNSKVKELLKVAVRRSQ